MNHFIVIVTDLRRSNRPPTRSNELEPKHAERLYDQLTKHGAQMRVELHSCTFNKVLKSNEK